MEKRFAPKGRKLGGIRQCGGNFTLEVIIEGWKVEKIFRSADCSRRSPPESGLSIGVSGSCRRPRRIENHYGWWKKSFLLSFKSLCPLQKRSFTSAIWFVFCARAIHPKTLWKGGPLSSPQLPAFIPSSFLPLFFCHGPNCFISRIIVLNPSYGRNL